MEPKIFSEPSQLVIAYSTQVDEIESTFRFDSEGIEYWQINKSNPQNIEQFSFDFSVLTDLDPELAHELLAMVQSSMVTLARDLVNYEFDSQRFHHDVMALVQQSAWYEVADLQRYFNQLVRSYGNLLELLMNNLQAPFKLMNQQSQIMINNTLH